MKKIIITLLTITISLHSFATDNCLRFMPNRSNIKIVMKKECNLIIEDTGKNTIASIDACLTKLTGQFPGKTSWGLIANIQKVSGRVINDTIIVNTASIKETNSSLDIDLNTFAPELITRYRHRISYNKTTEVLSVTKDKGILSLKNDYNFKLQCR